MNLPEGLVPQPTEGDVLGGHFSPVTRINHNAYEVAPAPLVTAQRLRASMGRQAEFIPLPGLNPHPREICLALCRI
jgi:hypothetical protein